MKITAAVLEQCNQPLVIHNDIEIPELKKGQVLCRIEFAGVCRSQLMEVQGKRGKDEYLPHMLGHEGAGVVIEAHADVKKVTKGDKVVLGWIKGLGIDAGGTQYRHGANVINAGGVTTFSNYAIVSENRLVKLPDGFDMKSAVLLGCALPTGAGIVLNELKPKANSLVGVFGLGGIGLSAVLALQHFNLKDLVVFDSEKNKLELAKELGASSSYSADERGLEEFWSNHPDGLDYIVESAGLTSTIETAYKLVKKNGGKCIFASHPPSGEKISLDPYDLICGKQISGSWGGSTQPDKDLPLLVDIINRHSLPVQKLLSKEYRLDEINQAMQDLDNKLITRALITMADV